MRNIALHLSERVRGLTGDLAHWVTRAGAKRSSTQSADAATQSAEVRMTGE